MPPPRSYTPLLAFKFETVPLHSLFTNKDHASFPLLYHDEKGKQEKTMTTIGFIIDGKETASASGKTFDRKDPVTGKVATTAPAANLADVDAVAKSAAKAFESWSETGPNERRSLLNKAADLMESRADEFTRLMLEETGATAPWSGFNVHLGAGVLREAAALTTDYRRDHPFGQTRHRFHGRAPAGWRGAWHGAMECADHSRRARYCGSTCLR